MGRSRSVSIRSLSVTSAYRQLSLEEEEEEEETNEPKSGPVAYDSTDWYQVLFQCFGSTWPKVIKFCLLNVMLMVAVTLLRDHNIIDLGVTGEFHSLGGMITSFLLVSRVNTALSRYSVCRGDIGIMYRETRELIQTSMILTNCHGNVDEGSRQWRNELAYRALILLRTSIAVVEYFSKGLAGWKCPELSGYEALYATPSDLWKRNSLNNDPGDDYSNTMRIPFRMAYLLRKTIAEQDERLITPIHVTQQTKLLNDVDRFMAGFYGMRKFITTPVPFPLVQMGRTMILLYVYTIPLVLLEIEGTKDISVVWDCVSIFLLTYGFMGLELVAIELDDPFGNDENDFDTLAFARMVFEDTYLLIAEVDGVECADRLRRRMGCRRLAIGDFETNYNFSEDSPSNEKTRLLSTIYDEDEEDEDEDEHSHTLTMDRSDRLDRLKRF